MQAKYDVWTVMDHAGVIHVAKVGRFYERSMLLAFQFATACHPQVQQVRNEHRLDWGSAAVLPSALLGTLCIMRWRVREAPTCIECMARSCGFES